MKKIIDWNRNINGKMIWEWFIELGNLDEIDTEIIKYRKDKNKEIKDLNVHSLARKCNVSEDTIYKRTVKLIEKYKKLMREYPNILFINKEYTNVQAIITIVDEKNNYYTIELLHRDFDSFKDIYYKVIEEMKKKYGIDLKEIGSYRTIISGSYHRNL